MKNFLEKIINNKKKLRIFLIIEVLIFAVLVSILTIAIINKNKVIETSELANIEIKQNEIPEIVEEEIDEEESAQELTEEEQEEVEKEENIANKEDKNKNDSNSTPSGYGTTYYIKVNYGANVVTVYTKDADGNYTVPVRAMVCSTGRATPRSGVYKLKSVKHRWGALFGGVWGQYTTQIVGNILFHSVPYLSANPSNLEYWEYDKLGTTASAGCVRLRVCDAKWIYDCMPAGTPVEFYSDSNPGPLGKPGAQKISGNEAYRGWDPTDPSGNNPWRNAIQQPEPTPAPASTPVPAQNSVQIQQPQNNVQSNNTEKNEENKSKEEEPKQSETTITENEKTTTENKDKEETNPNNNTENNESDKDNTADKNEENKIVENDIDESSKTENN